MSWPIYLSSLIRSRNCSRIWSRVLSRSALPLLSRVGFCGKATMPQGKTHFPGHYLDSRRGPSASEHKAVPIADNCDFNSLLVKLGGVEGRSLRVYRDQGPGGDLSGDEQEVLRAGVA